MNTIKKRATVSFNQPQLLIQPQRVGSVFVLFFSIWSLMPATAKEYLPGIEWDEPQHVTPGEGNQTAPSDAIILFDGQDKHAWNNADTWQIDNGCLVVGKGMIHTKDTFGDCQLHVEWSSPVPADGTGQSRGNSGIFFWPL